MADDKNDRERVEAPEPKTRTRSGASDSGAERRPSQRTQQRSPRSKKVRGTVMNWRELGIRAFAVVMLIGGVVGLLFFARPADSVVEKRHLTEYPAFEAAAFLNGGYTEQVSLWYADTYPLREPMVAADRFITGLYGISQSSGMVGGNVKADDIPVDGDSGGNHVEAKQVEAPADPPDERAVAEGIQENLMNGIYVENGAGYSIYYFDQNAADTYIAAMNKAAEELDGVATVYSLFAPASSIMLDEQSAKQVGGSDQQQTLSYLRTRFDERVKPVEVIDVLTQNKDKYLFFYTDHHWTELGAYYAYTKFCEVKGIDPISLDDRSYENIGELVGTYQDTIASVGDVRQDNVDAYYPKGTNDMTITDEGGGEREGKVVDPDAKDWDPSNRYSAFIAGDQPLEVIHNPEITDGSSCLLVKDSYGCAFAPLLVDHYETLYIIDFRYTDKNICDYVKENKIQDVIFLTGMKIGLVQTVADTLLSEVS